MTEVGMSRECRCRSRSIAKALCYDLRPAGGGFPVCVEVRHCKNVSRAAGRSEWSNALSLRVMYGDVD